MSRRRAVFALLVLAVVVGGSIATFAVGWVRLPIRSSPRESDCPEKAPSAGITVDDAIRIMADTYDSPDRWEFQLSRLVKLCETTDDWWSSQDGQEWQPVHLSEVPPAIVAYAEQSGKNLVLYVISARHVQFGVPAIDEGWIDGVSAGLVEKLRVAT